MKNQIRCVAFLLCVALLCAHVQCVDKSACLEPKEVGPCRKADSQYYYDTETAKCKQFFYGGCHGNNNRFATEDECTKTCL